MKAQKPLLILVFLIFLFPELYSQSLLRQNINCFGSSNQIDGGIVSETVGQAYFTNGFTDADIYLNPGFQQRMTAFIREGEIWVDMQIQLYPNPVSEELHLVSSEAIEDARIEILDINGKVIFQSEQDICLDMIIHLGHFADGLYNLRITDEEMRKFYNSRIIIIK